MRKGSAEKMEFGVNVPDSLTVVRHCIIEGNVGKMDQVGFPRQLRKSLLRRRVRLNKAHYLIGMFNSKELLLRQKLFLFAIAGDGDDVHSAAKTNQTRACRENLSLRKSDCVE